MNYYISSVNHVFWRSVLLRFFSIASRLFFVGSLMGVTEITIVLGLTVGFVLFLFLFFLFFIYISVCFSGFLFTMQFYTYTQGVDQISSHCFLVTYYI